MQPLKKNEEYTKNQVSKKNSSQGIKKKKVKKNDNSY